MKVRSLIEAQQLIGKRVRYMRRGGNRFGWEGVIDYANTQKVTVMWIWFGSDEGQLIQEYQMKALYFENSEWDDGSTYIMVLDERNELKTGVSTPEEDEEFERLNASHRPQEWYLAQVGRNIEQFGKLLQDPNTTVSDLAGAAHDAGLKLSLGIQPKMEETTNEGVEA